MPDSTELLHPIPAKAAGSTPPPPANEPEQEEPNPGDPGPEIMEPRVPTSPGDLELPIPAPIKPA